MSETILDVEATMEKVLDKFPLIYHLKDDRWDLVAKTLEVLEHSFNPRDFDLGIYE